MWFVSCASWAGELVLEEGTSRLIDRAGVSEVIVANGAIAQIRPINESVALVLAKSVGQTEMYFMQGQQAKPASIRVVEPGTLLGGLQLRLMVLEQSDSQSESGGLDWGVQVDGQARNGSSSLSASSLLSWLPSAQSSGLKVVAQPRMRMLPRQSVELKVGGEIERAGSDGATEDKEYGLDVVAEYHWQADQLAVNLQITLRTPLTQGGFRRQSLTQTALVQIAEVTEFARFDGVDRVISHSSRGLPLKKNDNRSVATHWRVVGWFEPLEN